jgi:TRAP-type C4-dicarboxylate transport system permease small subunit
MTRLSTIFGKLFEALAVLAALMLLAMVILVSADILLRNLTRTGFAWANEVSEYGLYGMTLLVAPWLLRRGQHVRIDLVLGAVPARVGWLMEAIGDLLGFLVCVVMVRYGFHMAYDSFRAGSLTIKNLVFPEWWLLWPLPLCFTLLAMEFACRLHRSATGQPTARAAATPAG